jgi:hypothetical protein
MSTLGVINAKGGPHRDALVDWLRGESEQAAQDIERLVTIVTANRDASQCRRIRRQRHTPSGGAR